jgi:hypothetical protein
MTIRNLQFLLGPESVALIGASPRAGSIGKIIAAVQPDHVGLSRVTLDLTVK